MTVSTCNTTLGTLVRDAIGQAEGYKDQTHTTRRSRRALLVTFTKYGEIDRMGRLITLPSHHTVGFLSCGDVSRYTMYNKPENGGEFFVSKHVNVKLRPCHVSVTNGRGGWKDYDASYCYEGENDLATLFVLADIDADCELIGSRPRSRLSFAAEALMVQDENGMQTFVGGNCKYRITATD